MEAFQAAHGGRKPRAQAESPGEKALANKYSNLPMTYKPRLRETIFSAVLAFQQQHNGALPKQVKAASGSAAQAENVLARRFQRAQQQKLTPNEQSLLDQVIQWRRPAENAGAKKTRASFALKHFERTLQTAHVDWCSSNRPRVAQPGRGPEVQRAPGVGATFAGQYAFPGLANLGSTCYLSSVLQCLLHCGATRGRLLAYEANADDSPVCAFRAELGRLARACVSGVAVDGVAQPAQFDVLSPHELLDAIWSLHEQGAAAWPIDQQHDACELLETVFDHTSLGALFTHAPGIDARRDIVVLPEFDENFRIADFSARIEGRDVVDVQRLLGFCMRAREDKLEAVPDLLAVRLPQFTETDSLPDLVYPLTFRRSHRPHNVATYHSSAYRPPTCS